MRILLASLVVFITINAANAQQPYGREKVVEVDTITSAEVLRATARKWFVDTYKDANEVIQMDDAATNTIVGKGWTEFGPKAGLYYSIEVQCKRGRARIRIYDVHHKGKGMIDTGVGLVPVPSWGALFDEERCFIHSGGSIMEKRMFKECVKARPEIDKRLNALVTSLEASLLQPIKASTSDW